MYNLKIIFIQRQFPHYRKAIFDALSKFYKIYLFYCGVESSIMEAEANYAIKIKYLKYWKKETNVFLFAFKKLIKIRPNIVVHEANPSILSLPFVFLYCRISDSKFVLWGHGYNRNTDFNLRSNIKTIIRLFLLKKSDAIVLYDNATKNELKKYIPEHKLFVAQNTLNTKQLLEIRNKLQALGQLNIKKELGFDADFNIIFLGRLLSEKKPFETIKMFEMLKNKLINKTLCLHIIGEGPEFSRLLSYITRNQLDSIVKLHGALYDNEIIGKKLFASDLLINPGYVGLNVNHALCFNIPIFTFHQGKEGPFHSPEVEFIVDGQTGFFSKPFDYEEMSEKILEYLKSPELQDYIKNKIKYTAENVITIENMEKGFHECFRYLNSK